jgi:hypothetical protein
MSSTDAVKTSSGGDEAEVVEKAAAEGAAEGEATEVDVVEVEMVDDDDEGVVCVSEIVTVATSLEILVLLRGGRECHDSARA